jgi:hypothetical protein
MACAACGGRAAAWRAARGGAPGMLLPVSTQHDMQAEQQPAAVLGRRVRLLLGTVCLSRLGWKNACGPARQ